MLSCRRMFTVDLIAWVDGMLLVAGFLTTWVLESKTMDALTEFTEESPTLFDLLLLLNTLFCRTRESLPSMRLLIRPLTDLYLFLTVFVDCLVMERFKGVLGITGLPLILWSDTDTLFLLRAVEFLLLRVTTVELLSVLIAVPEPLLLLFVNSMD